MHCPNCGAGARDADRFCLRCGSSIRPDGGTRVPSRPHTAPVAFRRSGFPLKRLVAGAAAITALVVGIAASGVLTSSAANDVPTAAAENNRKPADQPRETPPSSQPAAEPSPDPTAEPSVVTTSDDGRTYMCSGAGLLAQLDDADDRIEDEREKLAPMRRELRKLDREYPGRTAPADIADRYNELVRASNAQAKAANRRVDAYNGLLERECTPE